MEDPPREAEGPSGEEEEKTLISHLGEEITAIISPVSMCMLFCIVLVRVLTPHGEGSSTSVAIAQMYYHEEEGDSVKQKLEGGLINSAIFVSIVGAMTFLLFILFKYRCTKFIWGYMAFAGFNIFFFLGGAVGFQVIRALNIPVDLITYCFCLYNFSIAGVLAVFFMRTPVALKQGYLIFCGAMTAFVFTKIPEWTTWLLLLAMSAYDLCAVLTPGGPLKVLLELAVERGEDIPALIYESRPTQSKWGGAGRPPAPQAMEARAGGEASTSAAGAEAGAEAGAGAEVGAEGVDLEGEIIAESDTAALLGGGAAAGQGADGGAGGRDEWGREEGVSGMLPDHIKLGLGDFIFYSVMRAAMYDMMTAFACYLAIIAGLGGTLLLLAAFRKALPALPFSICLGVLFYLLARLVLEPFAVGLSTSLAFF